MISIRTNCCEFEEFLSFPKKITSAQLNYMLKIYTIALRSHGKQIGR